MAGIFDKITGERGSNGSDGGDTETPLATPAAGDATPLEEASSRTDKALREAMQELLRVGDMFNHFHIEDDIEFFTCLEQCINLVNFFLGFHFFILSSFVSS